MCARTARVVGRVYMYVLCSGNVMCIEQGSISIHLSVLYYPMYICIYVCVCRADVT
jgi:hypothetical protein